MAAAEVYSRSFRFDRAACEAAALSSVAREDVVALLRQAVTGDAQRRLAVDVFGGAHSVALPGSLATPALVMPSASFNASAVCRPN